MTEHKTDWTHIFNSTFGRIVIVCLLLITAAAIFSNRHIKIWEFEINGQSKTDTFLIVKKAVPDTIYIDNLRKSNPMKEIKSPHYNLSSQKASIRNDSLNNTGNIVTVTGNGDVAVGNSIIDKSVHNGLKQRHLSNEKWRLLLYSIPDYVNKVMFLMPVNDREASNVIREIVHNLDRKRKYEYSYTNDMTANCYDSVKFWINRNWVDGKRDDRGRTIIDTVFMIQVCPASNIQ